MHKISLLGRGKRSIGHFRKMDSMAKWVGSGILKFDPLPEETWRIISLGKGVNIDPVPDEYLAKLLMHKNERHFSQTGQLASSLQASSKSAHCS